MSILNRKHLSPRPALISCLVGLGFFLVFSGTLLPTQCSAQVDQLERLREYIDRNAELLEWAHDIVRDTDNMPARRVLEGALNLHRRSLRLLEENHPLMAYNTAKNCRTATRNSVRLARESLGFEERLRIRSERFRDQHAHLLEKAREANNQVAVDFLRRSEHMALRAYEQYQQGDARLAFKMLEQAEELLNRAARMLARDAGPERIERALEMAQLAQERAREKLQDKNDPAAWKLMTESEQALDRALDFRDQGQPGRSLQLAEMAQRLANRVASIAGTGPDLEAVKRQFERWDERQGRVNELVIEAGLEPARKMLKKASDQRNRAQQSLDRDEFESALRQIRIAHDLLTQAENSLR